ncbi:beta-galactosidase, domain 2-domain-containing protein [Aspergillus pseudocaelatus]|uniref:Beta-galactosidase n=1 Tax=Aspergillus pseudocaelatus TaxID=1825620 RepID=A0ABQ6X1P6_9EURO|nr:beta-galactosidase, domain 2-domain-containing protein [Aspergillus pseudocaelatus]
MWGLLEGEPGHVRTEGVFALDEFFHAASKAGIYLLARPGPYINAEVSGGGFPGWVQRIEGSVRTTDPSFLNAIENYISTIGELISKAQITNGGPVILFQPENEYSVCEGAPSDEDLNFCLEKNYMAAIKQQFRDAGVVVPFVNNDAVALGNWAPGTGKGAVDIYGCDNYPFGWGNGCMLSIWALSLMQPIHCRCEPRELDTDYRPLTQYNFTQHQSMSPGTPFSLIELQGSAPDQCVLMTTRLQGAKTNSYIIRHSNYIIKQSTSYKWQVNTSQGNITVPQLGGFLTLHGCDSKFHVTGYDLGVVILVYSTAEIFTWRRHGSKSVLVLYGGEGETHEFAVDSSIGNATIIEGSNVRVGKKGTTFVMQWDVIPFRQVVHFGEHLNVYVLWWNEAYRYWVMDLPASDPLGLLEWGCIDSLPEIQPIYDDDLWTSCNRTSSNNPRNLTTPTSHTLATTVIMPAQYCTEATLLLMEKRNHFTCLRREATHMAIQNYNQTLQFPQSLQRDEHFVLTVLVDNLGLDLNFELNTNTMKSPRGLLDYDLSGHDSKSDVSWKITGNLGGEQYRDHGRGPLNEGSVFVERQGYHLPGALNSTKAGWQARTPQEGLSAAGVGIFATTFSLDYPQGYDIPTSVVFNLLTQTTSRGLFRSKLFVNGW